LRLNTKIALTLVIPMLLLVGVLAWAINSQVLERFAALEQAQQEQSHGRLLEAMHGELQTLGKISHDWGMFDETYNFMLGNNPEFIEANLHSANFENLQINGMLFFDAQHQLRQSSGFDLASKRMVPLSAALVAQVAASLAERQQPGVFQGILRVEGHSIELGSSPITDSNDELAAVGSLVIVKFLDQRAVERMAKRIKLSVRLWPLHGPGSADIPAAAVAALAQQALWFEHDARQISSYSLFDDLAGKPALLTQISMPRDIYRAGLSTSRQLISFTFIALLLFVVATFFAIQRVALGRLSRLSQRLIAIGAKAGNQERLPMRGNDEITQVARSVNSMLDDLDLAFEQRRRASERQRELNALLVQIATDDAVAHGDTAALFKIMASSLAVGTSLDAWSLWLSSEDGQSFECLRASADSPLIGMTNERLSQALTQREAGLPNLLHYPLADPQQHGLILPFHVDSHLAALCVEAQDPQALRDPDERNFLIAATRLIERALRTYFQNLREQDLRQRAEIDALTGLANRSMFEIALMKRLSQAHEQEQRVGLLFIDLDKFKPINDTYGHAAGDWLLREVAERLQAQVRSDDLVARLGGDEFTVLLNNLRSAEDVERIAEKILQSLRRPFSYDTTDLQIGASIGVAWAPEHGNCAAELVKAADMAMYKAKQNGRDSWVTAQSDT